MALKKISVSAPAPARRARGRRHITRQDVNNNPLNPLSEPTDWNDADWEPGGRLWDECSEDPSWDAHK
jgi:hypothetical protein